MRFDEGNDNDSFFSIPLPSERRPEANREGKEILAVHNTINSSLSRLVNGLESSHTLCHTDQNCGDGVGGGSYHTHTHTIAGLRRDQNFGGRNDARLPSMGPNTKTDDANTFENRGAQYRALLANHVHTYYL
jgi:hypothetical protein